MKFKFIKKLMATTVAGTVITATFLPMSALAYSGDYIGNKTTTQTTDMGYATESQLVAYTHEIYAKTSIKSGPSTVATYVQGWYSTGNKKYPNTKSLGESCQSGSTYIRIVNSTVTYVGGVSYHYISSKDDTNTLIKIGYNDMNKVNSDIKNIE